MGQRHQLFVIAKINGRYRCLGAIHHQWLYGQTALRRCLDTLKIFGDANNRMPLQQELLAASKHDESFWSATRDEYDTKNSHVPFPFVVTCLIVGASFNVDGYYHGVLIEPFFMPYNGGDNNNGITIFDITDLDNIRYCFVDFHGMESEREVELNIPLSARTYLEAYYELDNPGDKFGLIPLLENFKTYHLITSAILKDTWPKGKWPEYDSLEDDEHTHLDTKTLREHSQDILLDAITDPSHRDADLIAQVEILPDFIPRLRQRLYDHAAGLPGSAPMLHLLHKSLEADTQVDLSPFKSFSPEELSSLVTKLRHGQMKLLCLSDVPHLKELDLNLILASGPAPEAGIESPSSPLDTASRMRDSLEALVLLENPQISIQYLTDNLGPYEIYHSELFRRPFEVERASSNYYREESKIPTLEFNAPGFVSQLIWVGISSEQSCDGSYRLDNGQIDWSSLKYSDKASSVFYQGKDIKYTNICLDVPLPAGKMIHALKRTLKYLSSPKVSWLDDWPKAAARCFATTAVQRTGSENGVGPLSTDLYLHNDRETGVESGKGQSPKPGQWVIVLVHEAFDAANQEDIDKKMLRKDSLIGQQEAAEVQAGSPEEEEEGPGESLPTKALLEERAPSFKPLKCLRYALVRLRPQMGGEKTDFIATDVPGYVDQVVAELGGESTMSDLSEWWRKETGSFSDQVGHYGDEDIRDILQKIYQSDQPGETKDVPLEKVDPFVHIMRLMEKASRGDA